MNYETDYICHHQVEGGRWYVKHGPPYPLDRQDNKDQKTVKDKKRFELHFGKGYLNKDGTVSERGRERLRELSKTVEGAYTKKHKWYDPDYVHQTIDESYRSAGYENGSIKKGSKLGRIANEEVVDERRKYAYLIEQDRETYVQDFDIGYADVEKSLYEYELTAVKDLKIADGKVVCDYILDKYGNETVKEAYKTIMSITNDGDKPELFTLFRETAKRKDAKLLKATSDARELVRIFLQQTVSRYGSETTKDIDQYFMQKGYDAMIDVEDWITAYAWAPLIIFNPKESVQISKKTDMIV